MSLETLARVSLQQALDQAGNDNATTKDHIGRSGRDNFCR
jgi:hypothetical protein